MLAIALLDLSSLPLEKALSTRRCRWASFSEGFGRPYDYVYSVSSNEQHTTHLSAAEPLALDQLVGQEIQFVGENCSLKLVVHNEHLELVEPEPKEIRCATISYVLSYFRDAKVRRSLHNEWSSRGTMLGVPLPPGVIIGRELHHTAEQLEAWRSELNRRLLAQIQDLGRGEPKAKG